MICLMDYIVAFNFKLSFHIDLNVSNVLSINSHYLFDYLFNGVNISSLGIAATIRKIQNNFTSCVVSYDHLKKTSSSKKSTTFSPSFKKNASMFFQ